MAWEISSPPGVCLTIPFPLPFPFPFLFLFPFPSIVPFPFLDPFSPPCVSSSPSPLSLSSPSPGWYLPLLGAPASTQVSSSSSSLIISSQFSGLTARKSPGLNCRQLGGWILAQRSLLPYQHNHLPERLSFPVLVVYRLERLTWSPKARGLSHLQLLIWSRVLSNICHIYERKAAHHSRKGQLLLLRCGYISWNCEKWRVVTGSRKIISRRRSHALWSLTLQTFYIRMSPQMCSEMTLFLQSRSNHRHRFMTDVGSFGPSFRFPLWMPFGVMAVSWKWIYIRSISIMIQLHIAEGNPERMYKVV